MTTERTQKSIFLFWLPLAAAWLMMSVEGPFLAAIIARLADPRFNLAAHGVAFAFALLIEAPVIMIMSASTVLAEDRLSFKRLRNFIYSLNGVVTAAQLLILIPAVFRFIMLDLVAIPEEVADLSYWALWILLPWPGAIGYRRFFQGILIRAGRTRLVAFGTVVRLTTMASTGLLLFFFLRPPGAWVGAASLSIGVMAEALASRLMARGSVKRLLETPEPEGKGALGEDGAPYEELTYGRIIRFYYPLALTSMIALAAQPMMTFFMGRAAAPVESLAVFPVVISLTFIFRSVGLSFQEVGIALMGRQHEHVRSLARFALVLAVAATGTFALVALTPLADFWFVSVSGLSPDLARYALLPVAIMVPLPFLAVLLSFQRGILVVARTTRPITIATALEVAGIAVFFPILGWRMGMFGVTAAAISILVGRIAANTFLVGPCRKAVISSPRKGASRD
ncbi:MAG: hypothetical protein MUO50_19570 [Longimicrobiales bacterium]|nr:hypothetical protein [Longimicrobiales bacterium]